VRALVLLAAAAIAWALPANADELVGTLKKIHDTGVVTLGYREDAIPFSFLNPGGRPVGYSIDLCNEIVADIREELGDPGIGVKYKLVTAETRIPAVRSGEIDVECGSTTSNHTRQKEVAFSPVIFVAGTKLLVRRDSGISGLRDLRGKTVVVTAGTTNETAIRTLNDKQKLNLNILVEPSHAQSYAKLVSGAAAAFATDDVLLYGFVAMSENGADFKVVGDYLSYEPYGLMYRKDDPDFANVVNQTFTRLAESRELVRIYNDWFLKRLPTGQVLGLPMSPQLEEIFHLVGVPD